MSKSKSASEVVKRLDALYEFDREPVSKDKLCSGVYFAGSFAGEHVAATEFVIGALFVNWGARTVDVIVGLLIGNLLAVLTWALICAPIAVQTRLTLYWYLRKIGGPFFTVIYNVLNAFLFCILAGCMITVSASAVRIPFKIAQQVHWYPDDIRFVLVVLVVGAVVVTLAILGFKRLAKFASVCSPWMFLMFIAGAVVMLPVLSNSTGIGPIRSFGQFWQMADKAVWTGKTPDGGAPLMSFWHVAAFAWICNLAMHGGLSDMALFRYAKKASYGFYSAFGMFLGHYLAWICAGVMGAGAALAMHTPLTQLDAGAVAYQALGVAGAIAVVIAGWTTSNPTLYRAGLALQAVTPNWPRWKVTLVAGTVTTIIACFPFVFTELLNFVGLYGLLLVPAGAIVLTEHWIFPRIGLSRYWASHKNLSLNWPALIAWILAIAFAMVMLKTGLIHLFFLFLPVYALTTVVYIILAGMAGAKEKFTEEDLPPAAEPIASATIELNEPTSNPPQRNSTMWLSGGLALAALIVCLVFSIWVFLSDSGSYAGNLITLKKWLIVPTLIYFVNGTIWQVLRSQQKNSAKEN